MVVLLLVLRHAGQRHMGCAAGASINKAGFGVQQGRGSVDVLLLV
jgi:hypothetical protein